MIRTGRGHIGPRCVVTVTAGWLLVLSGAATAHADPTSGTDATFTLKGGTLTISVRAGDADFGDHTSSGDQTSITGRLGRVTVTDRREAPQDSTWTATAVSTPFRTAAGASIRASRISYSSGPITTTGTVECTAEDAHGLASPRPIVSATGIDRNNTASWRPTITIDVPPDQAVGTYRGTITHSVA